MVELVAEKEKIVEEISNQKQNELINQMEQRKLERQKLKEEALQRSKERQLQNPDYFTKVRTSSEFLINEIYLLSFSEINRRKS